MMKNNENELRELYKIDEVVVHKSKLPKYALGRLRFAFAKAGIRNINGRTYSEKILKREVEKKNEELKSQKIAGHLEHPLTRNPQLDKQMHAIEKMWYDPETKLASAESLILNTSGGRDMMTLLKADLRLGASMRGWGTVRADGRIDPSYSLETVDFVSSPSFGADAQIDSTNLIESANSLLVDEDLAEERKKQERKERLKKSIDRLIEKSYDNAVYSGMYSGDYATYHKENCKGLYEHYGIIESSADKKKAEKKEPKKRFQVKDIIGEALIAGVDPEIYCKKLNNEISLTEDLEKVVDEDFTADDIRLVIGEARRSGEDVSTPEAIKRIIEITKKSRSSKTQILAEEKRKKIFRTTGSRGEEIYQAGGKGTILRR